MLHCCSCRLHTAIIIYSRWQTKQATQLAAAGYTTEALEQLQGLNRWPTATAHSWFQQAQMLHQTGRPQAALACLQHCEQRRPNQLTQQLKADIYTGMGYYAKAEQCLLTAVYMAPNRLRSKYLLMLHYETTGQPHKARQWRTIILNTPAKVPSVEATFFRQQAQVLL